MSSQPVEANVVLTADNSQYDQAMNASAGTTTQLMNTVDQLSAKVSKMTKTAGKSLIGISAADTGLIIGATKAWNDYEKQMERLRSQSAVLGRNQSEQNKIMKDYTKSVHDLRSEMGTTTTEAAKLVEVLSKVTSIRQTRDLQDLSKVFIQMSGATGESSEGLASSLTNLQKVMGTPINAQNTRKYADTFTYLAAQTNTSAQGLIDFTAQLAPVAESLGMNTKQVAGFATAFTKAGQEGGSAATAFTKVTGDMLKSIQSGSPELAHYANLVGMNQRQFARLARDDSAEAVVEIFEALANNSKNATTELNRLGLDGPRTIRAIMAMTREPGGIRAAMGLATAPEAQGATQRGYDATMKGLSDQMAQIREDAKQTAEAFATILGPAIEGFLWGVEKAASAIQNLAEGPIGKFLQLVMGIVAPFAAGTGAMLLFAGALLKVAAAFSLFRSSAAYGLREGFRGGAPIIRTGRDEQGRAIFGPMGGGPLGTRGQQLTGESTWLQRAQYNVGAFAGAGLGAFRRDGAVPESYYDVREALSRKMPWTEDYVRPTPGTQRGPLSYLAGAGAYGISQFVTPTFDAMRYADPTKRTQWAGREAPWASLQQRSELVRNMGRVGLEEARLAGVRAETIKTHADPLLTDEARQARLNELRQIRQETMQRRSSAVANETASRQQIAAQQLLTRQNEEAGQSTKKLSTAFRELGANVGGGMLGAGRAGMAAAWRSGMATQGMAMGATVVGGMTGSNALMLGGTGAMVGSMIAPGIGTAIGAGIGGAAGLYMDAAKVNDDAENSIKSLDEAAKQTTRDGSGLSDLYNMQRDAAQATQDYSDKLTKPQGLKDSLISTFVPIYHLPTKFASGKNMIEGIFGDSDVEETQKKLAGVNKEINNTEGAVRDLAKAGGVKLTGTDANQLKQLDEFMSSAGMAKLASAGIDLDTLVAARQKGPQSAEYKAMVAKISTPIGEDLETRVRTTTAGAVMMDSRTAQRSMRLQDDVGLFYDATNEIFTNMRKQGLSYLDILRSTEQAQQKIGDENNRGYELQMAVSQKAQQALAYQAPQMGRAAAFQQQLQIGAAVAGIKPQTDEQAAQIEQTKQATAQAILDNDAYFRQMLLAQQQYERSRQRAQEDYNLQRQYQEYDYQLQRTRAEENFNRMRARAIADYNRSVSRAWSDFHLQRQRQEDDYNHQLEVQAKQRVMSMNLYQRVQTQGTSSATWLSANAGDIIRRMRQQVQDLHKLRQMGVSNDAIQMYQLASPENQQQLARLVTEMTPQMTRQFNRQAGTLQRLSGRLGQDQGNLDAQEQARSFRLSRQRGLEDMNRAMDRQHEDFWRGLRQQRQDFNIMMDQQAQDYETQMGRQADAYKRTMDRSAEDMAHMADEITGSIESVLVRASRKLTGTAGDMATQALKSFRDLKNSTNPEAVALMQDLSQILDIPWKNPLRGQGNQTSSTRGTNDMSQHATGGHSTIGQAMGGVMPGYTPGRDVYNINVSGGEAIMRPEWTRAVGGEKVVAAMNHAARHGGFAKGGVVWPLPGSSWSTYPGHDGIDLNQPGEDYGHPFYAAVPGRISYVGTAHGYGDAIFETGPYGTLVYGHGSKVVVHAGQRVAAGQYIGNVGSTGHSTGPHLHFGFPGGTPAEALALLHGATHTNYGTMSFGGPAADWRSVLKDRYPKSEAAAKAMEGVHPLHPGDISRVINRFARQIARRWLRRTGGLTDETMPNLGHEPASNLSNEGIVHVGANRMGWGDQWAALRQIVMHESGFRNTAQNPTSTAYGMFQFLDSTWANYGGHKTSDPWLQTKYGLRYIKERYHDPNGAWRFWQDHNWYGDGAMFDRPNVIGVGERGPEAVIPLNDRGGEFLARSIGLTTMAGGRDVSIHNYRIDRSTNFTGPITVQANDPNELLAKLQARQRVRALSRPSLTGSAA